MMSSPSPKSVQVEILSRIPQGIAVSYKDEEGNVYSGVLLRNLDGNHPYGIGFDELECWQSQFAGRANSTNLLLENKQSSLYLRSSYCQGHLDNGNSAIFQNGRKAKYRQSRIVCAKCMSRLDRSNVFSPQKRALKFTDEEPEPAPPPAKRIAGDLEEKIIPQTILLPKMPMPANGVAENRRNRKDRSEENGFSENIFDNISRMNGVNRRPYLSPVHSRRPPDLRPIFEDSDEKKLKNLSGSEERKKIESGSEERKKFESGCENSENFESRPKIGDAVWISGLELPVDPSPGKLIAISSAIGICTVELFDQAATEKTAKFDSISNFRENFFRFSEKFSNFSFRSEIRKAISHDIFCSGGRSTFEFDEWLNSASERENSNEFHSIRRQTSGDFENPKFENSKNSKCDDSEIEISMSCDEADEEILELDEKEKKIEAIKRKNEKHGKNDEKIREFDEKEKKIEGKKRKNSESFNDEAEESADLLRSDEKIPTTSKDKNGQKREPLLLRIRELLKKNSSPSASGKKNSPKNSDSGRKRGRKSKSVESSSAKKSPKSNSKTRTTNDEGKMIIIRGFEEKIRADWFEIYSTAPPDSLDDFQYEISEGWVNEFGVKIGDTIWAAMQGFPSWPAKLLEVRFPTESNSQTNARVEFFGWQRPIGFVAYKSLQPFQELFIRNFGQRPQKYQKSHRNLPPEYWTAVAEAIAEIVKIDQFSLKFFQTVIGAENMLISGANSAISIKLIPQKNFPNVKRRPKAKLPKKKQNKAANPSATLKASEELVRALASEILATESANSNPIQNSGTNSIQNSNPGANPNSNPIQNLNPNSNSNVEASPVAE